MRIGAVAEAAGISAKSVRFYEARGLLPEPQRESNGYRDYPDDTVHRLAFIRRGRAAGLTVAQISTVLRLRDAGMAPCDHVAALLAAELRAIEERLNALIALRDTITALHGAAISDGPGQCAAEEICSYL